MRKTKYTAKFKFDGVIESIKKGSVSEIARTYGFGVNLLSKWRSDFLKGGHQFFDKKPDRDIERLRKRIEKLEQIIGKKEVELNLIKNFSDFYESQSGM
ncbi:MAG: transposase [Patescibacteria group bacterium]